MRWCCVPLSCHIEISLGHVGVEPWSFPCYLRGGIVRMLMSFIAGITYFSVQPSPRLGILRKIEKSFSKAIYHVLDNTGQLLPSCFFQRHERVSF